MEDDAARTGDRLEASRLLADRGWGKAAFPVAADVERPEEDGVDTVSRWPSPQRMLELAPLYREMGDEGEAVWFEVWAEDALAAGTPIDQPVNPTRAPAPRVGRVALALVERMNAAAATGESPFPAHPAGSGAVVSM